ncbi:hypothetical protein S40293_02072 [Stachybotrys chartarum IBT 40293]|nr:hypothetical protein S40293_02072 [Stachybotrys chartarum IBT 40293]
MSKMPTKKDREVGQGCASPGFAKKRAYGASLGSSRIVALLVVGMLATMCGASGVLAPNQHLNMDDVDAKHADVAHDMHLLPRGDCANETLYESSADAVTATAVTATIPAESSAVGVPGAITVPISTQTAVSTIWSVVTPETPSSSVVSSEDCSATVLTKTVSVFVTVTPTASELSEHCSSLGDATVSGDRSTVTNAHTELSFTSGLPDATVSGNPQTLTEVLTGTSFTSNLPDATVSGNPSTVTNVETDVSYTSGLPDATVSGEPSTITTLDADLSVTSGLPDATVSGDPATVTDVLTSITQLSTLTTTRTIVTSDVVEEPWTQRLTTVTAVSTEERTITTVHSTQVTLIITGPYAPPSDLETSSEAAGLPSQYESKVDGAAVSSTVQTPTSTLTTVVYTTGGPPATSTTVIYYSPAPYPSGSGNGTVVVNSTDFVTTGSYPAFPTAIVEISGGNKKPEPRGLGNGGTSNLGCTVMLIAAIMLFL